MEAHQWTERVSSATSCCVTSICRPLSLFVVYLFFLEDMEALWCHTSIITQWHIISLRFHVLWQLACWPSFGSAAVWDTMLLLCLLHSWNSSPTISVNSTITLYHTCFCASPYFRASLSSYLPAMNESPGPDSFRYWSRLCIWSWRRISDPDFLSAWSRMSSGESATTSVTWC